MVDFLKTNPYVTRDEYMWKWTVAQVRLASYDFTYVKTLSDKEVEYRNAAKFGSPDDFANKLGIPSF